MGRFHYNRSTMRLALVAVLVACSVAVPVHNMEKLEREAETQALLALKPSSDSKYVSMIPLFNQLVAFTAAIYPVSMASNSVKLSEMMLLQSMANSVGKSLHASDTHVSKSDQVLNTVISVGETIGSKARFNPVIMLTNVIGRQDMLAIIDDLIQFSVKFAQPNEVQSMTADHALLSLGMGLEAQEQAISRFVNTLSKDQKDLLQKLQTDIDKKLVAKLVNPTDGTPSAALVNEIERMVMMEDVSPSADELSQALIAIDKSRPSKPWLASDGKFREFLPLIKQVVIYTGVVLPSIEAHKQHKKNNEINDLIFIQSVSAAAGKSKDLESMLPSAEAMVDAMVAIGRVMGGSSGFNPVQLLVNTVGKSELQVVIDDIMRFPLRFPDPSDQQLMSAEQVVLSVGLGFGNQEDSINKFLESLTQEQRSMIETLEKDVVDTLLGSLMTPSGEPTVKLIEEIKNEMREMEAKTGSSDQMPSEFKQMVLDAAKHNKTVDELVQAQALIAVSGPNDAAEELTEILRNSSGLRVDSRAEFQSLIALEPGLETGSFKYLLPLVNQVVVYAGVVIPALKAKQEHKVVGQLSESALLQTIVDAANSSIYEFEGDIPSAQDMLAAMTAIGQLMGSGLGFNPIELMTNVVGRDNMTATIDEIVKFPFRFPDLTDEQISRAESMLLSVGLGFMGQEQALDAFVNSLDVKQKALLRSLQENVFGKLVGAMITPNGQPTPALVEEIKRVVQVAEQTGSSSSITNELKSLVQ